MVQRKNLRVGLFNAGSLGTRHTEFQVALESRLPDIMAINETWLRAGEEGRAPAVRGYRLRHIPRPARVRARGGGVGFYVKRGLAARTCKHPTTDSDVEQMWLSLSINSNRLIIGTAYRPPWLSVDTFFDALTESVLYFSSYDYVILLGDFNINILDTSDSKYTSLSNFLQYSGLNNCIVEPTHFTSSSSTIIDLVCSNVAVSQVSVDHIPELGAHAIIVVDFKIKKPKIPIKTISYRPLKDIDLDLFNSELSRYKPLSISNLDSVEDMVITFNTVLIKLFDLFAPIKRLTFKDRQTPWITSNLRYMMRLRDNAYNKCRTVNSDHSDSLLKDEYKNLKKMVTVSLYSERRAYFHSHINLNKNNPKLLWRNLKNNILPKKYHELPVHLLDPERINTHFLNVPGDDDVSLSTLLYFKSHRKVSTTFNLRPVSEMEVGKIILNLTSNAKGVDGISNDMVLLTLPTMLPVITSIINKSLFSNIFPTVWKTALINPIPKCVNPSNITDLRPISILPFVSKILEKIVYNQLIQYCESQHIFPDFQSGFRKGRSTSSALLDVVDNVLCGQDGGRPTILTLLDYSRAFDSINIQLLLAKMSFYGFSASSVSWFQSYLSGRSQQVSVQSPDGTILTSGIKPVTRGVPQGSILGPLLFILYTSDLPDCITHCSYHLYADDLQVYIPVDLTDAEQATNAINQDLLRISEWSSSNCLSLNPLKTKFMILGSAHQIKKMIGTKITLRGVDIERVDMARNLGLLMDSRLRFEHYTLELVRNCFYRLKVLYRIRDYLSVDVRVHLCDSLVLSKLNHCIVVYGPCLFQRSQRLIQRVQNACARYCFKIPPRTHVSPYLRRAKILNMRDRQKLYLASLLFGVIKTCTPNYLYHKIEWRSTCTASGLRTCAFPLRIPQHKTAAFRGSFRYSATKCWNDIPPPIRQVSSLRVFKIKYRALLLGEP